jgi:hypothetical protein
LRRRVDWVDVGVKYLGIREVDLELVESFVFLNIIFLEFKENGC